MPLQRVAHGEVDAVGPDVVVLRERLLRGGQVDRCAGGGLVILGGVVILLVVEDLEAHVDGAVFEIGLRKPKEEAAAYRAQIGLQAQGLAQSQEVVGLVVEAEESAVVAADAPIQADRVLAFLLHLEEQIDSAGIGILMGLGVLIDLERIEVFHLVQAQQAELPELRVVDRTLVEHQLAADDAVARNAVALELDARDEELLALVDIDIQRHGFLLLVGRQLGHGAEVDVAQAAVGLLQVV